MRYETVYSSEKGACFQVALATISFLCIKASTIKAKSTFCACLLKMMTFAMLFLYLNQIRMSLH